MRRFLKNRKLKQKYCRVASRYEIGINKDDSIVE